MLSVFLAINVLLVDLILFFVLIYPEYVERRIRMLSRFISRSRPVVDRDINKQK